jgi:8-oxo-dGTP pyrophosphatase MutT (NUDIX family)
MAQRTVGVGIPEILGRLFARRGSVTFDLVTMDSVPTSRDCRYQAAIVDDDGRVLLLRVRHPTSGRTYWLVPGGGREGLESEEQCVKREVREETHLAVEVVRLLWEEPVNGDETYRRTKTFLCRALDGNPRPGSEPEEEHHVIEAVGWFPLTEPEGWGSEIENDAITWRFLHELRKSLGV